MAQFHSVRQAVLRPQTPRVCIAQPLKPSQRNKASYKSEDMGKIYNFYTSSA